MKKILFILLCLPIIGFGQNLGKTKKIYKNGVTLSFNEPKGWEKSTESFAVDQNNLAVSYLKRNIGAMFQIYIANAPFKISKKEAKELYFDKDFLEGFISGFEKNNRLEIISVEEANIDDYPAIEVLSYGMSKTQKQVQWFIFYKDKLINVQGVSLSKEFNELYSYFIELKEKVYFRELQ